MKTNIKTLILMLLTPILLCGQTIVVNQQFSSVAPSGWSSTSSLWIFNNNYGTNSRSGSYAARLSSAANGNTSYAYIPITFKNGYSYTISFYSKRICSLTFKKTTKKTSKKVDNLNEV